MAPFITFEGIEGSGKTTQIVQLAEHLKKQGRQVVQTREPGGCPIADQIRSILLHPNNTALVSRAELLLYAAARAQHVEEVVQPALAAGAIVLCDRFSDATLAYQGDGRGLDRVLINQLNQLAGGDCHPNLTLLFDLPVKAGLARARQREVQQQNTSEGRFEREKIEFHQRIKCGYLALAAAEPERFRILDAELPAAQLSRQVTDIVDQFLQINSGAA